MALLVRDLLDGAYNRNSGNDPGKLAQDPELVAHVSRVYQRIWPLLARSRPDEFASTAALTLGGIPPAATLPADVIDVVRVETTAGQPVTLIPVADLSRAWHLAPAVFRRGRSVVSRNQPGDPTTGTVLTLTLLDAPAALTSVASALDARWPVRHAQLLVDALAVYLSIKDAGRDGGDRQAILAEAQQNAAALAAEFGLAPDALEWIHAPVERAGATA